MQNTNGLDIVWPKVFDDFPNINIILVNGQNYVLRAECVAWPEFLLEARYLKREKASSEKSYEVMQAQVGKKLIIRVLNYNEGGEFFVHTSKSSVREIRMYSDNGRKRK